MLDKFLKGNPVTDERFKMPNQVIHFDQREFEPLVNRLAPTNHVVIFDLSDPYLRQGANLMWQIFDRINTLWPESPYQEAYADPETSLAQLKEFIETFKPVTFMFKNYPDGPDGVGTYIYDTFVHQLMPHFDRENETLLQVYLGNTPQRTSGFMNQVVRIDNEQFLEASQAYYLRQKMVVLDGENMQHMDDFLDQTHAAYALSDTITKTFPNVQQELTVTDNIGTAGVPAVFAIQNYNAVPHDVATQITSLVDGREQGILNYWADRVVKESDDKYRRFNFVVGV